MPIRDPDPPLLLEELLDPIQAFALQHYLVAHGIACRLPEQPLRSALGEIPFLEVPARLYLEHPAQLDAARALIRRFRQRPSGVRGVVWTCVRCGERHEPEFGQCWQCGSLRA
ncbi:MAG: hypothetical protein HY423_02070 [Candidatus Lambdaproteobacteria bacterium]|nr:hypothetical protein [Candidatus Lambdaproteobacteria bacterium]